MGDVEPHPLDYVTPSPKRKRSRSPYRFLWWCPPLVIAVVAALTDPRYLRTGDPSYGERYDLSRWLFVVAFYYIPAVFVLFILLRLVRRIRGKQMQTTSATKSISN